MQLCGCVFAVIAAPQFRQDGIFGFFQKLNGVYFIPLLAIILVGMFHSRADGKSALITLLVGLGLMVIGTFFTGENQEAGTTGWLKSLFVSPYHYMGFVFLVLVVLQLALSQSGMKRASPYIQEDKGLVDLTHSPLPCGRCFDPVGADYLYRVRGLTRRYELLHPRSRQKMKIEMLSRSLPGTALFA